MSVVEYRVLLYQLSEEIDWQNQRKKLIFIFKAFLHDGSDECISDIDSLLAKLEEKNLLGIDRLDVMKELLKGIRKWDLLRRVEQFEIKRKDYKLLLEQISRTLDESSELQRLISICTRQNLIARERGKDIADVKALFTELEQQNNLGIENLTILKTLATEMEKPDLCTLLEEFEKKRKQDEDAEREKDEREDNRQRTRAQATSVLFAGINIGERVIGVVTPHCTFRNLTGGVVVVTTWMVLRRSPSMEAFVEAIEGGVLPLGNFLRAISEGSIRFTIQAKNISALEKLWQSYQDKTLETKLQEFLVTEDINQLAGGEVMLTVHIDEDEYRSALFDFIESQREVSEMRSEEKRGLKDRTSSESDLSSVRGLVSESGKNVAKFKEFMPFERKIRVEEFVENLQETHSMITRTTDSGEGTWSSAPTEGAEGSSKEKLDHVEEWITDALENLDNVLSEIGVANLSEALLRVSVKQVKEELEKCREKTHNLKESKEEIPIVDNQMELLLGEVKEYLFSSNLGAEGVIKEMKTYLKISQDQFEHPTVKGKKLIRLMARTAKHCKRIDVFHHLRTITPPGTTGPQLSDDLPITLIPSRKLRELTKTLSGGGEWMMIAESLGLSRAEIRFLDKRMLNPMQAVLEFVSRQMSFRVGTLYDLLNESELPKVADLL